MRLRLRRRPGWPWRQHPRKRAAPTGRLPERTTLPPSPPVRRHHSAPAENPSTPAPRSLAAELLELLRDDRATAHQLLTTNLQQTRATGDHPAEVSILIMLGTLHSRSGNHDAALGHHRQALHLAQTRGSAHSEAIAHIHPRPSPSSRRKTRRSQQFAHHRRRRTRRPLNPARPCI